MHSRCLWTSGYYSEFLILFAVFPKPTYKGLLACCLLLSNSNLHLEATTRNQPSGINHPESSSNTLPVSDVDYLALTYLEVSISFSINVFVHHFLSCLHMHLQILVLTLFTNFSWIFLRFSLSPCIFLDLSFNLVATYLSIHLILSFLVSKVFSSTYPSFPFFIWLRFLSIICFKVVFC